MQTQLDVTGRAQAPAAFSALLAEIARSPPCLGASMPWMLHAGQVVADRFELAREIGRGGFGAVWEARDRLLGRDVAFKAVGLARRQALRPSDLHREAETVARLAHPNVVQIFDAGALEDRPYLILELLRGETLQARLERGPIPVEEALAIAVEVGKALAHAHRVGILHRDLKPSNVFLISGGGVKVLDFGLARLFGRTCPAGGTPGFMPPEQRHGGPEDERSDVWALGNLLRAMLPEPPPDVGGGPPRPWPDADVRALVERMTAADPDQRPRHGAAALAALMAASEERAARRARARPPRRAGTVAILAATLAASAVVAAGLRERRELAAAKAPEERLVVVADVANDTGDRAVDAVSGLVAVSLEQSNRLSVLPRAQVVDLAREPGHTGPQRLTEATARNVARAARASVVLVPSARRLGDGYAVSVRGLDVARERLLFEIRETTPDRSGIPSLVDRLSERARRALGEGEGDLAASRRPVAQTHTASLEAYRHYFEAQNVYGAAFDAAGALAALRRALEADPGFALAHLEIAIMAGWHEAPEEDAGAHLETAALHARGLPDKERGIILGWKAFHEGRLDEARATFRTLVASHPTDPRVLCLAGETQWHGGTPSGFEEAASLFRRALDRDPTHLEAMIHLMQWTTLRGTPGEIQRRASEAVQRRPAPMTLAMLARAHAQAGDVRSALDMGRLAARLAGGGSLEVSYALAEVLAFAGRPAEAEAEIRRWIGPDFGPGQRRIALEFLPILLAEQGRRREALAAFEELAGTDCGRQCATFDEMLKVHLLLAGGDLRAAREEMARWTPPDEAEAGPHAWLWPFLGLVEEGERRAARLAKGSIWERRHAGAAALARGDAAEAVEILSRLAPHDAAAETEFLLGQALLAAGRSREALEPLERVARLYPLYAPRWQASFRPWSLFLLAQGRTRLGEEEKAREAIERLLATWRRADPGLPLLAEVRALGRSLGGRTGRPFGAGAASPAP